MSLGPDIPGAGQAARCQVKRNESIVSRDYRVEVRNPEGVWYWYGEMGGRAVGRKSSGRVLRNRETVNYPRRASVVKSHKLRFAIDVYFPTV